MKRLLVVTGSICSVGGVLGAFALALVPTAQASLPGKPGQIVFSSTFTGDREIFVAAADGSGRVDLTRDPHADVTPSWSADGKRIVFASDRSGAMEIYLMNADGSGVAQVTHDGSFADHPRFTADGRSIVYESKKGGNWEILRVGADGGGGANLTRNRSSDRYPAVSPNGRLVAFASNRGTTGTHIWVMNMQGGVLRQVTLRKGNQFAPAWAPAGGRLAYVSGMPSAGTNIWTVRASGKGDHALTALYNDAKLNPSWSADAQSLVYEDCRISHLSGCALAVMPLGGKPHDISPLRAPYTDTFESIGATDPFGQVFEFGSGSTTRVENGQLVETIAATAEQGGPYNSLGAGWGTLCKLVGDYDVQADYRLLEWPATNGITATLSDGASGSPQAYRESQTFGENYTGFIGHSVTAVPTLDAAGTLRVQRQGITATASYLSGAGWVMIASGPATLYPAIIDLNAGSFMNRFAHQEVKVAWDNFRINSGALSCPEVSWEDNAPDWQAAPHEGPRTQLARRVRAGAAIP